MGRIAAIAILIAALVVGGGVYYFQEYGFYREVTADLVVTREGGLVQPLATTGLTAIDAASSPIRFRACFTSVDLPADARPYPGAEPLNAPTWFSCFDATAIGGALAAGTARAYLGQENVIWGIDRILAITDDGRGYAWHQINACGRELFDGRAAPAGCPPRPEADRPPVSTGY